MDPKVEFRKLDALTKEVYTAITKKLLKKLNEGYTGWDTASVDHLRDALIEHLGKATNPEDYLDIINYAIFIRAGLIEGDEFDEKFSF